MKGLALAIRFIKPQHFSDVAAGLGIGRDGAVFVHGFGAGVVGRQGKPGLAVVAVEHFSQVAGAALDVFPGVEGVADLQVALGLRHDLHQTFGPLARNRLGIEAGLGTDHGLDQGRIDPVAPGGAGDVIVVDVGVRGYGPAPGSLAYVDLVFAGRGCVGEVHHSAGISIHVDVGTCGKWAKQDGCC